MTSRKTGRVHINRAMLLVFDKAGKVQAVTSHAADDAPPGVTFVDRNCAEIFGARSPINRWFSERIQEARGREEYSAETRLENGDGPMIVRLESLTGDHKLYGFALQVFPLRPSSERRALHEGDSIVARRQWHEIKNHIGALKLYATFLKRKMPEGDERRIVEKIFNGVNSLIGYLDRIRRGDPQ